MCMKHFRGRICHVVDFIEMISLLDTLDNINDHFIDISHVKSELTISSIMLTTCLLQGYI